MERKIKRIVAMIVVLLLGMNTVPAIVDAAGETANEEAKIIETVFDDRDPRIVYEGDWKQDPNPNSDCYGGTLMQIKSGAGSVSLTFDGTKVAFKTTVSGDGKRGYVDIYLDGEKVRKDLYLRRSTFGGQGGFNFAAYTSDELENGRHTIQVVVNKSSNSQWVDMDAFVVSGPEGVPEITTGSFPTGTVGSAYRTTLKSTGSERISWAISEGSSLPAGLELKENVISGTPTVAGEYTIQLKAENTVGSAEKEFKLMIEDPEQGYYDVSGYRSGMAYTPPVKDDCVFAGWYTDDTYTTPLGKNVTTGMAYAKFVDAEVLSVKYQIGYGTTLDDTEAKLRFVTTVDSLRYESVGFRIKKGENEPFEETTKTVYETLAGYKDESTKESYKPSVFSEDSKFFMALRLAEIPQDDFDVKIVVTPLWVTLDGTTVFGAERELTIQEAISN